MKLLYSPEGGEPQAFELDFTELLYQEAEAIENVGGEVWDSWPEFMDKFRRGNRRAFRAYLWIMLRRTQPKLRFQDLALRVDELELDFDSDEIEALRAGINVTIPEEERRELLEQIEAALEAEMEAAVVETDPKASASNDSIISSPSAQPV